MICIICKQAELQAGTGSSLFERNGMTLLNVPEYPQYLVRGALIFLAVLLNRIQRA